MASSNWVLKSLIKELFAKVWAQCEETTRDGSRGWEQCGRGQSPDHLEWGGEEAVLNFSGGKDPFGRAAWNNLPGES